MAGIYIDELDRDEKGGRHFRAYTIIADMNYEGSGPSRKSAYIDLYQDIERGAFKYFKNGLKQTENAMEKAMARAKKANG